MLFPKIQRASPEPHTTSGVPTFRCYFSGPKGAPRNVPWSGWF